MKFMMLIIILFVPAITLAQTDCAQQFENLGTPKSVEIKKINPEDINTSVAANFLAQLDNKFKSCLANVHKEYENYKKENNYYPSEVKQIKSIRQTACEGLEVSAQVKQEAFNVVAKRGEMIWSVDETKTIKKVR